MPEATDIILALITSVCNSLDLVMHGLYPVVGHPDIHSHSGVFASSLSYSKRVLYYITVDELMLCFPVNRDPT